jgi:hypothetical protein
MDVYKLIRTGISASAAIPVEVKHKFRALLSGSGHSNFFTGALARWGGMVAHLFALAFKDLMAEAFDFRWQLITGLKPRCKTVRFQMIS